MLPAKRLLDIVIASAALIAASPLMLVAAVGIKLTSPGPILYCARRMGVDRRRGLIDACASGRAERRQPGNRGCEFTMYKFRTMDTGTAHARPITARQDSRIFPFGAWLRLTKFDELPQLFNVLKGDMSLVGPRPEDPEIVREYYSPDDLATLRVLPGVTSPGTLYYYTHGEKVLEDGEVVQTYVERLLPVKLAIDRVYIQRASVLYDLRVIARTVSVIVGRVLGSERFPEPPELAEARVYVASRRSSSTSPA